MKVLLKMSLYCNLFKRLFDLLFAAIVLPFFVLLLIPIALLIKIEDGGSVFYIADRIGKNGILFKMYKIRSMKASAPDIRLVDGSTYSAKNDYRVNKIGKFIRETSIDETPQIINILFGQMSWIGPRPDPPDWLNRYPNEYRCFLKVKPGITGYNQAYFRNETNGHQKMVNDKYYAENISLGLDIKILFRTILNILKRKNIYKEE